MSDVLPHRNHEQPGWMASGVVARGPNGRKKNPVDDMNANKPLIKARTWGKMSDLRFSLIVPFT
jgi:hypothetical protein